MQRLELSVFGRVQGVGFRFFAEAEAMVHRVNGFVRNAKDGSVEIVCEGEKENLLKFLKAIEKGPPTGKVERIKDRWHEAKGEFKGFTIKY